jgi:xylan 1,4-beta-xylosidase
MTQPAERARASTTRPAQTYRNPIIAQRHLADPHVICVSDTYYLYPTSHGRGYDVFVSRDLVHWENKGTVFESPRGGAWAPDVFHHVGGDGKFYLYYTDDHPDRPKGPGNKQIGVAVADSPLGPFREVRSLASDAIDAHLFQDTDGRLYLYYTNLAGGFRILVREMADPCTPRGEPVTVLRPTDEWERRGFGVTEGAFMLKRGRTYYLMYSGSPADTPDYAIGYATSDSPLGPFTKYPGNPIVHRTENVVGPGHHCVIDGPDGRLWMVYHQKRTARVSYDRFIAIDPIWFDEDGVLHARVTRGTTQPAPGRD